MPENKYRHELKYVLSVGERAILENRLRGLLSLDPHAGEAGEYEIRSLYFDDREDRCLRENRDGVDPREKFRMRLYNGDFSTVHLECKRKERDRTQKTACPLTDEEAGMLVEGQCPPLRADTPPLLRKLIVSMRLSGMHPAVIVAYRRRPYIYRQGNVRITFDSDIASGSRTEAFPEEHPPLRPILPPGTELLEVKFDDYLPEYIRQHLQPDTLQRTGFSKYALCRQYQIR